MKLRKTYLKCLKGCIGEWFVGDQKDVLKEIHRLRRKVKRLQNKRWKSGMPNGTCFFCEHWTSIGKGRFGNCSDVPMVTGCRVTCRQFKRK